MKKVTKRITIFISLLLFLIFLGGIISFLGKIGEFLGFWIISVSISFLLILLGSLLIEKVYSSEEERHQQDKHFVFIAKPGSLFRYLNPSRYTYPLSFSKKGITIASPSKLEIPWRDIVKLEPPNPSRLRSSIKLILKDEREVYLSNGKYYRYKKFRILDAIVAGALEVPDHSGLEAMNTKLYREIALSMKKYYNSAVRTR